MPAEMQAVQSTSVELAPKSHNQWKAWPMYPVYLTTIRPMQKSKKQLRIKMLKRNMQAALAELRN